jgi:hypothetical protein
VHVEEEHIIISSRNCSTIFCELNCLCKRIELLMSYVRSANAIGIAVLADFR